MFPYKFLCIPVSNNHDAALVAIYVIGEFQQRREHLHVVIDWSRDENILLDYVSDQVIVVPLAR